MLRKLVKNHAVALAFVLPNIAISTICQLVFNVYLHWTGWLTLLSYYIGAGSGFEFGLILAMLTKSNFKIGRWRYSYAREPNEN